VTVEIAQMPNEIAAVWDTYIGETTDAREFYDQAIRAAKQANAVATAHAHAEHAIALDSAWETYAAATSAAWAEYVEATKVARSARDYGIDAARQIGGDK